MRVLQVTEELYPNRLSGMAKHVHDLSQSLSEEGVKTDVLVAKREQSVGFGSPPYRVISGLDMLEVFRHIVLSDYDIVHLHQLGPRPLGYISNPLVEAIAQAVGSEVVVTPHGAIDVLVSPPGVESAKYPSFALQAYLSYISTVESRLISSFIGVSPGQLEMMSEAGIPETKQAMIPNGLPAEFFDEHSSDSFVQEYDISEETVVLFYIGRLTPRKRVSDLIRALNRVRETHPQVQLFIAGPDGGSIDDLRALAHRVDVNESVSFMGKIDDPMKHAAYERSDVFVNPSEYEAFGITLIEAMAHHTPIVSADNLGAEYILGDDEYGLVYECGDIGGITSHIDALVTDPDLRERLASSGYERALEFRWTNVVTQIIDLYETICK